MAEIGLVSCTNSKKDGKSVPKELYMESPLFKKARRYVEKEHDRWFILSAKHGILNPEGEPILPYDSTLRNQSKEEKKNWSQSIFQELKEKELLEETLIIHAGKDYYKHLLPILEDHDVDYRIPLEGLAYGERLAWYKENMD